jgi:DNA-binding SARP family transcriptional activator/tetratricopeptide (TPR) repeat protein
VDVHLLGAVEVHAAGRLLDVGPPRQRAVVAALAVDVARPVPVGTLVERVWGEAPPQRAREALYVYTGRIRGTLRDAGIALFRRGGGYILDVAPERVDVHRFRQLVRRAGDRRCAPVARLALLREAVDLWRDPPLLGVAGDWAARVREGWRQEHLDAVLAWAGAERRAGNGCGTVGPLTDLLDRYPLAESLAAALMRALCAGGRTAQALECYAEIRRRLVEELGVDPGADLRAAHRAALRGELDRPPAEPAGTAAPAQLPPAVPGFTGRAAELRELDALLGRPAVAAITGTAGVGKTTLAVHWAHRVAGRFPDGQLYVNLRGFDPGGAAVPPDEAVHSFLAAFGVPPERFPTGLPARAGLYRSLLAGKRILVILDNAADAAQVRPLLPGAPGCLTLVTSRHPLTGLVATDGAVQVPLGLLTEDEAARMLRRRLGAARVTADPEAMRAVIDRCARLPLALAVLAARATTRPGGSLRALAAELHDTHGRLDVLDGGEPATDVRAVFSWSYRTLTPDAARMFRLLALHPTADAALPAAASLAGVPAPRARRLLAELVQAQLAAEDPAGRYACHDLLRAYATELVQATDSERDRRAALRRVVDHYVHSAERATWLTCPHRDPVSIKPPRPGTTVADVPTPDRAARWLADNRHALIAVARRAADLGLAAPVSQLARTLGEFLHRGAHWTDGLALQQAALEALRRTRDPLAQARAHRGIGSAHVRLGQLDEGERHLRQALDRHRELADPAGEAHVRMNLCQLYDRRGYHREALDHARRAADRYAAASHQVGLANALNAVGWCHGRLGEYDRALDHCRRALPLLQALADIRGEADVWHTLGHVHDRTGDHGRAADCYQRALVLFRDSGARYEEADTLVRLGDARSASGDRTGARDAWSDALPVLLRLGHPDAEAVRSRLA